jgi:hypothetical protein
MLCRNCSPSHTEQRKIEFAIFGFFYDFILNLQVNGPKSQNWKNLLINQPSAFARRPSGRDPLHNLTLPRRSKLAGGEVGPEEAIK